MARVGRALIGLTPEGVAASRRVVEIEVVGGSTWRGIGVILRVKTHPLSEEDTPMTLSDPV